MDVDPLPWTPGRAATWKAPSREQQGLSQHNHALLWLAYHFERSNRPLQDIVEAMSKERQLKDIIVCARVGPGHCLQQKDGLNVSMSLQLWQLQAV